MVEGQSEVTALPSPKRLRAGRYKIFSSILARSRKGPKEEQGLISVKRFQVEISKGRFKIHGSVQEVGQDLLVSIWGGTRPHIGAVGIAIPRPSLKNPKQWSATSSNFTFLGHKEDGMVKKISELLATRLRRNVVVTAGVHWDGITSNEIETIQNLTQRLSDRILKKMQKIKLPSP